MRSEVGAKEATRNRRAPLYKECLWAGARPGPFHLTCGPPRGVEVHALRAGRRTEVTEIRCGR
jgi:hypothetical protein